MNTNSSSSYARATVWAAVIGCIGAITSAWIGLRVGRDQQDARVAELEQTGRQREDEIDKLRRRLLRDQAAELVRAQEDLKVKVEKGPIQAAPKEQYLYLKIWATKLLKRRGSALSFRAVSQQKRPESLVNGLLLTLGETENFFSNSIALGFLQIKAKFHHSGARIANRSFSSAYGSVRKLLVHHVATSAAVDFGGALPSGKIALLQVLFQPGKLLEYRDVPIQ